MEHERDTRLHVEDSRSAQVAILDSAGHAGQSAQGIDRIVVSEQQNWPAIGCFTRRRVEVDLQTVAEVLTAMETGPSAQSFELGSEEGGYAVDRRLVVARRFDFD